MSQHNSSLARALIEASGLYHNPHVGQSLTIRDIEVWKEFGVDVYGFTTPFEVNTDSHGLSLLHETMHALDMTKCMPGTIGHERWQTNGYYALSNLYEYMVGSKIDWQDGEKLESLWPGFEGGDMMCDYLKTTMPSNIRQALIDGGFGDMMLERDGYIGKYVKCP
jgi:hypothetical protein